MDKAKITKYLVILFFITISTSQSQHLGFSLGYASSEAIFGDIYYRIENSSFHFGYTTQILDAKGKEVSEQKSNYGKTIDGSGEYYYTVDLGYGYKVIKNVRINAEFSIGYKKYYTNYIDKRFNDGGYHMIDKDETILGVGGSVSYIITKIEIFIGYNSIKELGFGFRYSF